jgi:hypothetical protein
MGRRDWLVDVGTPRPPIVAFSEHRPRPLCTSQVFDKGRYRCLSPDCKACKNFGSQNADVPTLKVFDSDLLKGLVHP